MKFNVTVEGGHQAEVTIEPDGKGGFTGIVVSADYGTGEITNGKEEDSVLTGNVSLGGYTADFNASIKARR